MKINKYILICLIIFIAISMTACVNGEYISPTDNTKNQILLNSGSMYVYTFQDSDTGVWYISSGKGLTPRLNKDGSLYIE